MPQGEAPPGGPLSPHPHPHKPCSLPTPSPLRARGQRALLLSFNALLLCHHARALLGKRKGCVKRHSTAPLPLRLQTSFFLHLEEVSLPCGQKVPETVGEGGLASKALRSEGAADRDRAANSTWRSRGPPCRAAGHSLRRKAGRDLRDLGTRLQVIWLEKGQRRSTETNQCLFLIAGMPGQRVGLGHHGSEGMPQVREHATG